MNEPMIRMDGGARRFAAPAAAAATVEARQADARRPAAIAPLRPRPAAAG